MGIIKKTSAMFQFEARLKKLIIYLSIAVILFGIGYFAWLNHNDFEKAMVNQNQEQLMIIAKSEAQSIQSYINDIHDELETAASQPGIHEVLKKEFNVQDQNIAAMLKDTYRDVGRLVDSIYLINLDGVVINTGSSIQDMLGKNLSEVTDVKETLKNKKSYTSAIFSLNSNTKVIAHTHPVMEDGKLIGLLRALILVDRINGIASHINQAGLSVLVLDGKKAILSYPQGEYLAKNIEKVLVDKYPNANFSGFRQILSKIQAGEQGGAVIKFISLKKSLTPESTIISFCPIFVNGDIWSIAVFMSYDKISGPINRNLKDNIIFVGFIMLTFTVIARVFYSIHKKKDKLEIEKIALAIINRELHADLRERKRIEEEVQKQFGNRKSGPGNS